MKIWSIALRSLRREWRAGELRIVALALTIATTAVVSVASFGDRLHQTLARQGGELLGADLVVHVQAPPKSDWIVRADELGLRHARVENFRSVSNSPASRWMRSGAWRQFRNKLRTGRGRVL